MSLFIDNVISTEEQYINNLKGLIIEDEHRNHIHYKVLHERYFDCIINDIGQLTEHLRNEPGDNSIGITFSSNNIRLLNNDYAIRSAGNIIKTFGMFTKQFKFANYTWTIEVRNFNLHIKRNQLNISLQVNDILNHDLILVKLIFCFRNCDCPNHDVKMLPSSLFFFTESGENGYKTYIFRDEFLNVINPLIRNGRIKIGLYLRMYDPNDALEKLYSRSKELITNEEYYINDGRLFECAIDNFSRFEDSDFNSSLRLAGYTWSITLIPKKDGYIDFKLELSIKSIFSILKMNFFSSFVFYARNGNDLKCIEFKAYNDVIHFNKGKTNFTFSNVFKKEDLYKKRGIWNRSIIENDRFVFGFYYCIYDIDDKKNQVKRKPESVIAKDRELKKQWDDIKEKERREKEFLYLNHDDMDYVDYYSWFYHHHYGDQYSYQHDSRPSISASAPLLLTNPQQQVQPQQVQQQQNIYQDEGEDEDENDQRPSTSTSTSVPPDPNQSNPPQPQEQPQQLQQQQRLYPDLSNYFPMNANTSSSSNNNNNYYTNGGGGATLYYNMKHSRSHSRSDSVNSSSNNNNKKRNSVSNKVNKFEQ